MKHQELTEELRLKSYQISKLNRNVRNLTKEIDEMQGKIDTIIDLFKNQILYYELKGSKETDEHLDPLLSTSEFCYDDKYPY